MSATGGERSQDGAFGVRRAPPLARNLALAALALLFAWFAWSVRSVLNPLIAGYFLAFCVHPFVRGLERRGWSRKRAVNTIFCAAGAVATLVAITAFVQARKLVLNAGPTLERIGQRADEFLADHPEWVQMALERLEQHTEPQPDGAQAPADLAAIPEPSLEQAVEGKLTWRELLGRVGRSYLGTGEGSAAGLRAAGSVWDLLRGAFGTGFELLLFLFLLPIYTWFLLFELERVHVFVRRYVPRSEREHVTRVGAQIGEVIATFFRGRLLVCLLKGLVLVVGFALAGVDYALLIGLVGGFSSLVPFVGPFLTGVAAFLLALPDHGFLHSLVAVGLVFAVGEFLEGYVLIPKILGDSLGLHPIVILVCVFVGGAALGVFGFLIAIPLTATCVILAREYLLPVLAKLADEEELAIAAGPSGPSGELWTPGGHEPSP